MKLLDVDWMPVLAWLPRWETLGTAARRAFLTFKPTPGTAALDLLEGEELRAAGLADPPGPRGALWRVRPEAKPLLSAMRAMERIYVLDAPGALPEGYLQDHFTFDHLRRLSGEPVNTYGGYGWSIDRAPIAGMVSSTSWVGEVLELANAARRWEQPRRMQGEPAPVEPRERFEAAYRMADMTPVLVEAVTEPIPVRGNDGRLYVRAQQALGQRLPPMPAWVAELVLLGPGAMDGGDEDDDGDDSPAGVFGAEERVMLAVVALRLMDLAILRQVNNRWRLEATKEGRRWLELPEGERLKHLLATLRGSPQRVPASHYDNPGAADFFGVRLPFELESRKGPDLRTALETAFLSAPAGAMVPLHEFMEYQAQVHNPFTGSGAPRRTSRWSPMPTTPEGWESTWALLLNGFLLTRLVAYGGARLGLAGPREDERHAFELTNVGRYLLGATEALEYAPAAEGEVVVQPDFEIVFLAPVPRVEAELGRFAERTGAGMGALFRITRASVLRAAEQGLAADAVLATLEQVSRRGVPANVARQVRDWIGGTRRVSVRPAVLIECPDPETAGRVRGLGGAQVTEVTPTLLRLDAAGKARAALVKKLREKGIFVQE